MSIISATSFKEFHEDFNKVVKPQIEEILELLKNQQTNNVIEAAAAKIINELKTAIHDCPCKKEILDDKLPERAIILKDNTEIEDKISKPYRYSYPNNDVGNSELGTGKNPDSMTWPFSSKQ